MAEAEHEMKVVSVVYECDEPGCPGVLDWNGIVIDGDRFIHVCSACDETQHFNVVFPKTEYRSIS